MALTTYTSRKNVKSVQIASHACDLNVLLSSQVTLFVNVEPEYFDFTMNNGVVTCGVMDKPSVLLL